MAKPVPRQQFQLYWHTWQVPDPYAVIPSGSSGAFHRLPREHARLDSLDLYAQVLERTGGPISDTQRINGALSNLRDSLVDVMSTTSTLHGWRAQALFEAIVASLGRVRLLKLEDSGDVFFEGDPLKLPDFRIVTSDGEQILVEVKNFHQKQPREPYRIRRKDLEELQRYAHLVDVNSLKFGIYWSRWKFWSLTDSSLLKPDGRDHFFLSFPDAMMANEMGRIGDRTPGTEWPIGLVFYSDPAKPRHVNADGDAHFTVARAEYVVAGRLVTAPAEKLIVQRLMFYGGWPEKASAEIIDDEVISTSFLFSPEEPPSDQQFALHRPLSSIYSAMFNEATMDEAGEITALRVDIDPGALAALIPDDYEGEALRVWRFHLQPG
ncbi:MAG: hypothetical protein ACRDS9_29175 [Pseudonocardiaceae bacterium]